MATASTTQERAAELNVLVRKQRSLWGDAVYRLMRNKAAVGGLIVIALAFLVALLAPLLAPYDPLLINQPVASQMEPQWTGSKYTDARFLLAGDGSAQGRFQDEIAARALDGSARLLGGRTDLPELHRAADGFVLLSLAEGMSNSMLEAMASGLPLLAPRVSGVIGLVEHGAHGALFDPRSVAEAGQALRWLADDPVRASTAGARCRGVAEALSLERSADLYVDLYSRCPGA